jgi:hypothetical protein
MDSNHQNFLVPLTKKNKKTIGTNKKEILMITLLILTRYTMLSRKIVTITNAELKEMIRKRKKKKDDNIFRVLNNRSFLFISRKIFL